MILDVCCGGRMFYFDKSHPDVIFGDIRKENHILCDQRKFEVSPDLIFDFRNLPFKNEIFDMVVFDPPHLTVAGNNGWQSKKFGKLPADWHDMIKIGFEECVRVLKIGGTLIFKWNTEQVSMGAVLSCFSQMPLLGQRTTKSLKTHWLVFYKTSD